ncbi:unnamed protein product [Staurois parvus]|uniref:Uncharacterized protein n=1 Tax=Staurois parvus TaxID=386267 RepID=A0ABN9BDH7_9NEOB|nr:unnamed protein product [Staurois parvus]
MGPCDRLLNAAARSRVCHGSLYGLPLLLSLSPHSAMCLFQVSSITMLVVSIFVIGCCMASHCCCLHRHISLWLHTLVLAP